MLGCSGFQTWLRVNRNPAYSSRFLLHCRSRSARKSALSRPGVERGREQAAIGCSELARGRRSRGGIIADAAREKDATPALVLAAAVQPGRRSLALVLAVRSDLWLGCETYN